MTRHFARKFSTFTFYALFVAIVTSLAALTAAAQVEKGNAGKASAESPLSRKSASASPDITSPGFLPAVTYDSGGGVPAPPGSLAVADVNGDGKPDLIVANTPVGGSGSSVGVLLGNGDGTFQPVVLNTSVEQVGELNALAVADVNGDGKPDLVVIGCCSSNGDFEAEVLLGNGDGTFQPAVSYDDGGRQESSLVVADVNGDGRPDIVVVNWVDSNNQATANVLLGNGDGTFQPFLSSAAPPDPACAAIADVNHDGKPDLLICSQNTVAVLLGNGDGTFQTFANTNFYDGFCDHAVAVADVNADGFPDIVVANAGDNGCGPQGFAGILLGKGDGTFQAEVNYPAVGAAVSWFGSGTVGDVNGDGKPDVIVSTGLGGGHGFVGVLLGNGDGTFQAPASFDTGGSGAQSVVATDLNGDGRLDIVVANWSGTVGVLLNPEPTTTKLASSLNPSTFGEAVTFTATVTSKFGTPTGTVAFSDGSTTIGSATLASGIASVSASPTGGGKQSITAAYQGGGVFGPSKSALLHQVVNPATTATALASSALPGHINQAITYTATVSSEFGGTPTGTVTFLDGTATVATVALSGTKAACTTSYPALGTHSITAIYSGDGNDTGSTSSTLTEKIFKDPPEPYPSVTTVSTSGSPSFVGQAVTFTAKVTSSYGAIPDGEVVTFYDDPHYTVKTEVASGTTVGGVVTFTTSSLVQKGHIITATYAGDAKFKSASATVQQTVDQYQTTTTLVPSQNPTDLNEAVTFFITVTSAGGPTPTGQVNVPGLGLVTLSGGAGSIDWPAHGACGKHGFQALYLGDAFSATSRSVAVKEFVICGK